MEKEKSYKNIDIENLAYYLAEQNWLQDTKSRTEEQIYDMEFVPEEIQGEETGRARIELVPNSEEASLFFLEVEKYKRIIESFMSDYDDIIQERAQAESESGISFN